MKRLIVLLIVVVVILGVFFLTKDSDNEKEKKKPEAFFTASPQEATINETTTGSEYPTIQFDASESNDPDGEIETFYWNFGDGNFTNESKPFFNYTYYKGGDFEVKLIVIDNDNNEVESEPVQIVINYHREDDGVISSGAEEMIIFPVEKDAKKGEIIVNITYTPPNSEVEISVYDPENNQVGDTETKSGVTGTESVEISLTQSQFSTHGYGYYILSIKCTQGSITYDSTINIKYS